jgi:hypothetical protein
MERRASTPVRNGLCLAGADARRSIEFKGSPLTVCRLRLDHSQPQHLLKGIKVAVAM